VWPTAAGLSPGARRRRRRVVFVWRCHRARIDRTTIRNKYEHPATRTPHGLWPRAAVADSRYFYEIFHETHVLTVGRRPIAALRGSDQTLTVPSHVCLIRHQTTRGTRCRLGFRSVRCTTSDNPCTNGPVADNECFGGMPLTRSAHMRYISHCGRCWVGGASCTEAVTIGTGVDICSNDPGIPAVSKAPVGA